MDVFAEQVADLLLLLQTLHHVLKGAGQLAHFVGGMVLHPVGVIAVEHMVGHIDQAADRLNNAGRGRQRNDQADQQDAQPVKQDLPLQRGDGFQGSVQIAGDHVASLHARILEVFGQRQVPVALHDDARDALGRRLGDQGPAILLGRV